MQLFFAQKRGFFLFFVAFLLIFSSIPVNAQDENEQEDPVEIFNQGQDAHEKGDYKTAIELYRKALKLAPEFPEAEYQLGSALLSTGNAAEAEAAFRRALELREDWTLAMAGLGSLLVQKNQFAEAEKILTQAVELDEMNFPAYAALTELRLKTKAKPEILKPLLAKLQYLTSKANPPVSIWIARASVERVLGDKVSAKSSLNRALSLDPGNKQALAERIELAFAENDLARALEDAKTLNNLSPTSIPAKYLLARALAENGKPAEALKILDAIENPPADVQELRDKILVNSTTDTAELVKQLEKDPKNAAVLGRLCTALRKENPLKALEYCRRAAEAEPTNLDHAIGYGAALVQAQQFENAATLFMKILQIAPDNFTVHANLATALFQLKRFAEAKTQYQWLAEKQPNLAITYYFLAITHDQLTEYLDAMANYQQFLRLADSEQNKLEIEKVNLRLPTLQKQIKEKKGKRP